MSEELKDTRYGWLLFGALVTGLAVTLLAILRMNHGTFLYALDDPYIHLALSDQIRHGNYGLQAGVHAAPSSSILFPFLLAPFSRTFLHAYIPLILNILAFSLTARILYLFLGHLRLGDSLFVLRTRVAAILLLILTLNVMGVVFTGLEHSLHIAAVAATIYGMILFLDEGRLPVWLPVAIVLAPLMRYEGLALSLAALIVLAFKGRARLAIATFLFILAAVGGFSLFLMHLGLPPLPSSILVKSKVAAGGVAAGHHNFLSGIAINLVFMHNHPMGIIILLGTIIAAYKVFSLRSSGAPHASRDTSVLFMLVSLVGAHAVAGQFGWRVRYEVYLLLGSAMMGLYIFRQPLRNALSANGARRRLFIATIALIMVVIGEPYLNAARTNPLASNNIYEQDYQLHVFVDRYYRGPVAVNDIGLVTYHNPYPVLDLWGLGSEQVRKLREKSFTADMLKQLVDSNGVHLVMIFEGWFPNQIPKQWINVGTLKLSRPSAGPPFSEVQFFATDPSTASTVRQELTAYRSTLYPEQQVTIH